MSITSKNPVYSFEGGLYVASAYSMPIKYLARDYDQRVYGYTCKHSPNIADQDRWACIRKYNRSQAVLMIPVGSIGINWKNSLIEAVAVKEES